MIEVAKKCSLGSTQSHILAPTIMNGQMLDSLPILRCACNADSALQYIFAIANEKAKVNRLRNQRTIVGMVINTRFGGVHPSGVNKLTGVNCVAL